MRSSSLLLFLLLCTSAFAEDAKYKTIEDARNGLQFVTGLVTPLDQTGHNFYLLNQDGQVEVKLAPKAEVGLLFRENNIRKMLLEGMVTTAGRKFTTPKKLYLKVYFPNWKTAQAAIASGKFRDGFLSAKPLPDHLPTEKELWLSGAITDLPEGHITPGKVAVVAGKKFEGTTSGPDYAEQLTGLFDASAIKPFVNQAVAYGKLKGDVFIADYVLLRPVPDQVALDDPKLPRYLFIGDSLSGNYGPGLRAALKGKFNIHHPPTNCGASSKGREQLRAWLGDCKKKGRHWDVISFNFGHWDSGNNKETYQANLEYVITELEKTGAKLIWVTTCPVPGGYEPAGDLVKKDDKLCAPGRKNGVMKKYLNPWAAEVIKRHPSISVCDQWSFVTSEKFFDTWNEEVNDVHLKGTFGVPAGRQLARLVLDVTGNAKEKLEPAGLEESELRSLQKNPWSKNFDKEDFLKLLDDDARLRKFNTPSQK